MAPRCDGCFDCSKGGSEPRDLLTMTPPLWRWLQAETLTNICLTGGSGRHARGAADVGIRCGRLHSSPANRCCQANITWIRGDLKAGRACRLMSQTAFGIRVSGRMAVSRHIAAATAGGRGRRDRHPRLIHCGTRSVGRSTAPESPKLRHAIRFTDYQRSNRDRARRA